VDQPKRASEIPGFLADLDAHLAFLAPRQGESELVIRLKLPGSGSKHAPRWFVDTSSAGRQPTSEAAR
jgi:hypothetical protein